MGFLSSLFGKKKENIRSIQHPEQLKKGDVVVFSDSFALPEIIRKQSFQIKSVNTYQFEHSTIVEFVLLGHSTTQVYLSVERDDEEYLNISIKISREQVAQLFDMENFADIFDEQSQTELSLNSEQSDFNNWLSPVYFQQVFAQRGYYYSKDFRPAKPSIDDDGDGEPLDYFCLTSADEMHSVEVEVWQDGDTDVLLTIHRPIEEIADMYPGANDGEIG
ncbi:hypothetical protein [Catenovulum sediminis]|uniref:DUF4178 domain-containing protein n=1 Tax=Catenovulum sediminis TaxID=1740262 RepID=A0ABV1RNP1_9ALTE|nr:hypothetical protein [Catenovulum sediminis]